MELVQPIRNKQDIEKLKTELAKSGTRNLLLFTLGINSGLRISDILPLRVKDVKDVTAVTIKEEKTGKIKRFPLNDKVKEILIPYIAGKNDDDFLFPSRTGNSHITRIQAYRILNTACRNVGIQYEIGTHTLRKTFGYWHYQQFHDVALLQKILNHSAPSVTLRYIGISQDMIDTSINELNL